MIKLLIVGKDSTYFLNILRNLKINIYHLEKTNNSLKIIVSIDDYNRIMNIKTTYSITIINRYGLVKAKYLIEKYFVFIISSFIALLLIYTLSQMIFKVEIIHSNKYIRDIVREDLKEFGISKYHFKVSYKKRLIIVGKILSKEKDNLEWLEIEDNGTTYTVKVEERVKNKQEEKCPERNIIAKRDAMILEIDAISGEVVKKKYDYVKKGDVLISGLIYNKEHIVSKRCARGRVFGEIWYKVRLLLPKDYQEEALTTRYKYILDIGIFKNIYSFFNTYNSYKREVILGMGSNILPININVSKYQETTIKRLKYNDKYYLKLGEDRLNKELKKDYSILSKNILKRSDNGSKIEVDIFYKVKEDITDYQSIENINISSEE